MDHWLEFSSLTLGCPADFSDALQYLDQVLGPITFLVGHSITIADLMVWGALRGRLCSIFQDYLMYECISLASKFDMLDYSHRKFVNFNVKMLN